jgi:hypothetical protein
MGFVFFCANGVPPVTMIGKMAYVMGTFFSQRNEKLLAESLASESQAQQKDLPRMPRITGLLLAKPSRFKVLQQMWLYSELMRIR